jgi:hypothetical protein
MYFVLAVLGAMAPATVARRLGHRARVVVLVFVLKAIGLLILGFGLLALMLDGYVEDYGSEPVDTLDRAILGLASGAVCSATAWYVALRRPTDGCPHSKSPNTRTSERGVP